VSDPIDDGGPAFPCQIGEDGGWFNPDANGMSKRDWFAGQLKCPDSLPVEAAELLTGEKIPYDPVAVLQWAAKARARLRYIEADAMIAAGKETP